MTIDELSVFAFLSYESCARANMMIDYERAERKQLKVLQAAMVWGSVVEEVTLQVAEEIGALWPVDGQVGRGGNGVAS